jgi:hypothetical protein
MDKIEQLFAATKDANLAPQLDANHCSAEINF